MYALQLSVVQKNKKTLWNVNME